MNQVQGRKLQEKEIYLLHTTDPLSLRQECICLKLNHTLQYKHKLQENGKWGKRLGLVGP